eukprot:592916-Ditylum_brightwellii.AAC.1
MSKHSTPFPPPIETLAPSNNNALLCEKLSSILGMCKNVLISENTDKLKVSPSSKNETNEHLKNEQIDATCLIPVGDVLDISHSNEKTLVTTTFNALSNSVP